MPPAASPRPPPPSPAHGSTYTQNGASPLIVGSSATGTGTGTLNVADSAVFTTGIGGVTVNQRGTINVNTGGTFDANADITIDAGHLTVDSATLIADGIPGTSDPADAHTLNVTNGGVVDILGTAEVSMDGDFPDSSISTTGFGGVINLDGTLNVGPDALLTLNAQSASTDRWNGGSGGQIYITGGTANLDGTVRLNAADGESSGIFGAYGDGGDGGTISVTGGTLNQASTGTLTARTGSGATLGTPGGITVDGGTADLAGSIDLRGRLGQPGISALAFGPTAGSDGGGLTVVSGTATVSGAVSLIGGNGGVGVDAQDGEDGGDGGDVVVSGGTLTLNTPAAINLSPGTGGDPGPSGGSAGADGSAGVVLVFTGATLDINGASIFVDAGDPALAEAVDPIAITNATINVGIVASSFDGGTLNLNDNATLDNATLNRDDFGAVNLAATKTLTAANASTIDYLGPTTIGTDQTVLINTASTFKQNGDLTLDDGALILDDATLDADGNYNDPATQRVQGFTLTLNGPSARLDVQSTAIVDLGGGDATDALSPINNGQLGGSLIVNDGAFNLDTTATLDLDGGDGAGSSTPAGNGGSGGTLTVAGGTVALNGTTNIRGGDGEDITMGTGSNVGGHGGTFNVQGGNATLAGPMSLTGGNGGDDDFGIDPIGGDGGDGGLVDVSGGTLTLNTGASIDLSPGLGGVAASADGIDGTPGSVSVTGGTLTLNAGLITGDNTVTPLGTTTEVIGLVINLSLGALDGSSTSTTFRDTTLNQTGGTATFHNLTTRGNDTLITIDAGTFTINNQLTMRAGNIDGPVTGAGTLTKNASSTSRLSGALPNAYAGPTTVNDGNLEFAKDPGVDAVGGDLTINGGAALLINPNQIPDAATVTVNTPGTLDLDGRDETVGTFNGDGDLQLGAGAANFVVFEGSFYGNVFGTGAVAKQTNATFTFGGTTDPAGRAPFDVAQGTLHLDRANLQSTDDDITIQSGATLSGIGDTAANIIIQSGGTFTPGNSPGVVNIGGAMLMGPAATLIIEAQPPTPIDAIPDPGIDYDQVNVTGGVVLNGTLDVDALPDPAAFQSVPLGTKLPVLTYATRLNNPTTAAPSMFTAITGTLLDTSYALAPLFTDIDMNMDDDTLILRALVPGDTNGDLTVSVADLSTFALNFNTTPGLYDEAQKKNSWELGDFNADGAVTVSDLSLLALNFGFDGTDPANPVPGDGLTFAAAARMIGIDPATLSAVPEPAPITTLLAGALLSRRRTRQAIA